ncbi:Uncharacterized conserved protein, DUF1697 family [Lutibacter agarilyticus]|uniref:Uncharacterized conserved protein, DUF1697 family n=1 Tax=Lutibacter agarilyticus TaxID=1109740 RepID=A0A238YNW3_9FLAO|nr:DUF1697 domain-containing protein [Lutibacter agarilyticus]SNR72956.1 Uncharacterized conserved protein, DUF1697 family [Lutibacter agarilyticus]
MASYIALLRGINVTGHNNIKMADLKQLFLNLGHLNVTTYIQSGNVIFNSKKTNIETLEKEIIDTVYKNFGYNIKVLVITKTELETIFNNNPFVKKNTIDRSKLHVTLLSYKPNLNKIETINCLNSTTNDEFKIKDKSIYLNCPNGYGKTKLNNNFFEKKLNVSATTRNWKTITKLIELSA